MTLFQFCDKINANLLIVRRTKIIIDTLGKSKSYYCCIEHAAIKEGIFLKGEYGNGRTVKDAAISYIRLIKGKHLVLYSMLKTFRKEYIVPKDLCL